jgi:hypothetical protein
MQLSKDIYVKNMIIRRKKRSYTVAESAKIVTGLEKCSEETLAG